MPGLLVADDMAIVRSTVINVVKREKLNIYPITEASSGEEAVNLARQTQPDIVLIDIKMPGLDGLQAASTIRAEQPNVKIVVLSAYHEFSYVRRALKLGAIDYLLKPVRPSKLVSFLAQIQTQVQKEQKEALKNKEAKQIEQDLLESVLLGQSQTSLELMTRLVENLSGDTEKSFETIQVYLLRLMVLLFQAVDDSVTPATGIVDLSQCQMTELFSLPDITEVRSWASNCLLELIAMSHFASQNRDPVQQAIRFIDENYHRPNITFDEIASAVHLSSSHLAALFKAKAGISYIKYLTSRRIEHAKTLLRTSNLTVADVAEAVGYQTVSNFYRLFQRETGMTPTAYRNIDTSNGFTL